jgi:hypothetical protein
MLPVTSSYVAIPTRWLQVVELLRSVTSMWSPTTVRECTTDTCWRQLQLVGVVVRVTVIVAACVAVAVPVLVCVAGTTVLVLVRVAGTVVLVLVEVVV